MGHGAVERGRGYRGRGEDEGVAIRLHLDELLGRRGMTLTELSARVGITIVNLSILKNGRARAIRFSTLARLCEALGCQPGELLRYQPRMPSRAEAGSDARRGANLGEPTGAWAQ
jgi:putative transcriptional regulator